jgi:hypothetical protein
LLSLASKMVKGQVEAFEFTEPALLLGACAALGQVELELVEPEEHLRVDVQAGAADAGVFMLARGGIRAPAPAELDLAFDAPMDCQAAEAVGRGSVLGWMRW